VDDPAPLGGRVALVTGASRGIGRAAALAMAGLGAHCVLTARSQGGLEETDDLIRQAGGVPAVLLPLDLSDGGAVDLIGPSLAQRFGHLDILVHAAADLGALTPVSHITGSDWDRVMAVNLSASWRLIRTAAPLLRAAPNGRAIFLTDGAAADPRPFWGLMSASKAAMEALVRTWAAEEASSGNRLRIDLFDPGPVATRLRAQAMPGEDPSGLPAPASVGAVIARLCLRGATGPAASGTDG
jgi:NAD(P)-dependent dehydrogenase (short-subunit alcohol dehydrogenase family)